MPLLCTCPERGSEDWNGHHERKCPYDLEIPPLISDALLDQYVTEAKAYRLALGVWTPIGMMAVELQRQRKLG